VVSPLKNIAATCQTCHRESEEVLRGYVYERQDKVLEIRNRAESELAKAHLTARLAWDNGATQEEMDPVLQLIRQAQWRWDYTVASHGGPFHAPVESVRILAHSLDKTMAAQLALQKLLFAKGVKEIVLPDISTKAKAQAVIGLKMDDLRKDKAMFMQTVVPQWIKTAQEKDRL
jgi:nitrite reductase (cytochrome c-552)